MNPESLTLTIDLTKLMDAPITAGTFAEMAKTVMASATMAALTGCPCCTPPSREFTPKHRLPPRHMLSPQLVTDLRGGARAIRRQGWARGTWIGHDGAVCGLGGVMVGIAGYSCTPSMFETGPLALRYQLASVALQHWLGIGMPMYNDQVARSAEDVIGELEALAFEIECALALAPRPRYFSPPRVGTAIAAPIEKVLEPAR